MPSTAASADRAGRTEISSTTWSTPIPIACMRSATPRPANVPCSGNGTGVCAVVAAGS